MSFSDDLEKFADKTLERFEDLRRVTAIKLFGAIIEDSPVLTGRLRANWRITGETAAQGVLTRTNALSDQQVVSKVSAIGNNKALVMTNNLPYAARIEYDGWSHSKSPEGMVRHNVIRIESIIKDELKKLKS